jgi:phage-related baseplate assembly protein
MYSPTTIDLSRVAAPDAIEALDYEAMFGTFRTRFLADWNEARVRDPSLPEYDVSALETDPAVILGQAWTFVRLLDRARVNDAIRAVLAPFAKGADLDAIAASVNIVRLTIVPAANGQPAIMESNEGLLRRYLLSFDRPAAGSRDRYLFDAWTAWPQMSDASVLGYGVHGKRGDVHIVISGPDGRAATDGEFGQVFTALHNPATKPEAVALTILRALRVEYAVSVRITIPAGPDGALIAAEAAARIKAVTDSRTIIGGEIPAGMLAGAAYGPNVITVEDLAPVAIAPDPYAVPVCTAINVDFVVRA